MLGAPIDITDPGYHQALWLAICFAGCVAATAVTSYRTKERRHQLREQDLELSVRERTQELRLRRNHEEARNRIMEMLVSNQPLGAVLDAVAELTENELPGVRCVILLRNPNSLNPGCHVGSAPFVAKDWVDALQAPRAVPFEVWKGPVNCRDTAADPAWRVLAGLLGVACPKAIRTRPVGGDSVLGAVVLLEGPETVASDGEFSRSLAAASRLGQIAIEHRRLYEDLQYRAWHDTLTGLPNRALFEDRLRDALHRAEKLKSRGAVMMVELDSFKRTNDALGHRSGDLLLAEIAARLRKAAGPGDTLSRNGSDEFSILMPDLESAADAHAAALRILEAIRQPATIAGNTVVVTASIGFGLFPDDGMDPDVLQRAADAAMYCAKGAGGNRIQAFSARNDMLDRVRVEQEIRAGLRDRRFVVHYQPQVGSTGQFIGLEALVRLTHPEHGVIPPMQFIPVAEESGLIVPLGAWVLEEVCRQKAEWEKKNFGNVPVAVNVSPVQIASPDFARQVGECMARHHVDPSGLELELTEGLFITAGAEAQHQMEALRSMGLRISIDDFGTGYSSLSYLHKLEVDSIKLDRSFVQSIDTSQAARRLVQAMIGVAQGLGLNVVAEGVETEAQLAALVAAGCPMMQGYLFSRPVAASEVEPFLAAHSSGAGELDRLLMAVEIVPGVMTEAWPV